MSAVSCIAPEGGEEKITHSSERNVLTPASPLRNFI